VFRLNLAHGDARQHERALRTVREQAAELGRIAAILVDLPGPKMRTGPLVKEEIELRPGDSFVLTSEDGVGDWERVSTTVPELPSLVELGEEIFLADGKIVLRVTDTKEKDVVTEVVRGGVLRSRKGMHIPSAERKVQTFSSTDEDALRRAVSWKADLVGLSFVRDAEDVERARAALPKRGHRPMIVAKIETAAAIDSLTDIVRATDVVMVARGDLGIQLPFSAVPHLQKRIIGATNDAGKPVVTATQMLESMTHSPLPSRAEVSDVATAIADGTDAVMLSEETAVGDYPVEAVRAMAEIADRADRSLEVEARSPQREHLYDDKVSWAVAHAAVQAAEDLAVSAILCPTRSGSTALRVAAYRPSVPIVALSERPEILGPLSICWGVRPLAVEPAPGEWTAEEDVERAAEAARRAGVVARGDLVAVVAGSPGKRAGRTDYVRIARV
jgi:pyruvate kinase